MITFVDTNVLLDVFLPDAQPLAGGGHLTTGRPPGRFDP